MLLLSELAAGELTQNLDTGLVDECKNYNFKKFVGIDEYTAIKMTKQLTTWKHTLLKLVKSARSYCLRTLSSRPKKKVKTFLQRQSAFREVKAYVDKFMKEENFCFSSSIGKLAEGTREKTLLQDVASFFWFCHI